MVTAAQWKQSISVNKSWGEYLKEDFDADDVCTIKVEGNTSATPDFSLLPVMVMKVMMISSDH